jgi:hypothetical protein
MKKAKSRELTEAVILSNQIHIETQDDIYLHSIICNTDKQIDCPVQQGISVVEINDLFDEVETKKQEKKADTEMSLFLSNKYRNNDITNTFLIDSIIASCIKLSNLVKRQLTVDFIAYYAIDCSVTDKFDEIDVKLNSKLASRISNHLIANSKRKKSLLYNQVNVINRDVVVSNKISELCCKDASVMM